LLQYSIITLKFYLGIKNSNTVTLSQNATQGGVIVEEFSFRTFLQTSLQS
jgi:hypothetical protein